MFQAGQYALLNLSGCAAVTGQGWIREERHDVGHGVIMSAAQGEELRPDQPGQMCCVHILRLKCPVVEKYLLQGRQGKVVLAGDCGQDFACSADPAKEKKLVSWLSQTDIRSCKVVSPF